MKRSEFFGSPSVSESTKERETAEAPALTAQDQITPTAADEEGTSVEDLVGVSSIESPAEGVLEDVSPPDLAANASPSDALGAESETSSEGESSDEGIVARGEEPSVAVSSIELPAEGVLEDVPPPDIAADASLSDASGAESGASSEGERNDEGIVAREEEPSVEDSVAVSSMESPAEEGPRGSLTGGRDRRRFALRRVGGRARRRIRAKPLGREER